jgi:hypothetical protein
VKLSPKRAVAATSHAVVPLKDRKLNFGNKWDFAPAPEDSKNYVIAPQHELFIGGKFVRRRRENILSPSIPPPNRRSRRLRRRMPKTWIRQ